jgi:hypothetical protein
MNAVIRRAAGYPLAEATPPPTVVGDFGIGRGAGAAPRRPPAPPGMSAVIRAERELRREELWARARAIERW